MSADLIHDFDSHLKSGHAWRVILELPFQDELNKGCIEVETYVIAPDQNLAQYIASTLYPDSEFIMIDDRPIRERDYVSRRDRSRV